MPLTLFARLCLFFMLAGLGACSIEKMAHSNTPGDVEAMFEEMHTALMLRNADYFVDRAHPLFLSGEEADFNKSLSQLAEPSAAAKAQFRTTLIAALSLIPSSELKSRDIIGFDSSSHSGLDGSYRNVGRVYRYTFADTYRKVSFAVRKENEQILIVGIGIEPMTAEEAADAMPDMAALTQVLIFGLVLIGLAVFVIIYLLRGRR